MSGAADAASGAAPLLETRGLRLDFGGLRALQGVDLILREGEILGLIGPNGSGKTTFFNVLTGIYRASGGTIRFAAHGDISRLPPHRITRLGIGRTFQNQRLFDQMSVLENVLVGLVCRTRAGLAAIVLDTPGSRAEKRAAEARAMECLAVFRDRLVPRRHLPAMSLSYTNRRRLEIARALATGARVLMLDEPAAGLSPAEVEALDALLSRLRAAQLTVVLIEHHVELVMAVSDRVTVLDEGRVIADAAPDLVQRDPAVVAAYLGTGA
jgi:ABC-type branched-subunit amino acid transport system ATPase component